MAFGFQTFSAPITGSGLHLQSHKATPRASSVAEAQDEDGNVCNRTLYGASDTILAHEAEYSFNSGTFPTSIQLGMASSIESVSISTSNGDWPKVSIKWHEGLENICGSTFTVNLPPIEPKKKAQSLGATISDGGRLNSSTVTYSCDYSEKLDDKGNLATCAFSKGMAELTSEGVLVSDSATWTVENGWDVEEKGKGINESNTAYATIQAVKASKALSADA